MQNTVKSNADINHFLEKTNSLHDGYILKVQYENNGISKTENGHSFRPEQTRLVLKILVTSIFDTVVELEFESLSDWQIKENPLVITDTSLMFDEHGRIVWSDDVYTDTNDFKNGSYVIADSMKWKIT